MVDDATLIKRTLAGDRHAFKWLIKSHERLVYGLVWKIIRNQQDTEDICQEVFLKVYEKLDTFHQDSKLSTWIARIAYNQALSKLRKRDPLYGSYDVEDESFKELLAGVDFTPVQTLEARELKSVVQAAIQLLPVHYRCLVELFHMQEMSYSEVVEITGMPEGTVKNYLFRARKLLKKAIQKNHELVSQHSRYT
jgi:RNA polymerase sigma-70 factor (ECF subfamily)